MSITSPIFNVFGRSPIRPLQEHMAKARDCANALVPFIEAVLAENWSKAELCQANIAKLEKQADAMKKDLRLHLPKGLFLPVARSDLLELLIMQDRVANKAEDIAGLILGRKLQIPTAIAEPFLEFVKRSVESANQAYQAINELDELLETGFRGNEVKIVEEMIVKLDQIEQDTDEMQVQIRHAIFAIEATLAPVNTMFLYKVIDWIGDLADRAQTVGGQLQLLLAR